MEASVSIPFLPARSRCAGSGYELEPPQAGALTRARVALENAGTAAWRDLNLSYHWLDDRGNPIIWDGLRYGGQRHARRTRRARARTFAGRSRPARYRLAFDLVDEQRFWLAELGNFTPELDVDVAPRDATAAHGFPSEPSWTRLGGARSTPRTRRATRP